MDPLTSASRGDAIVLVLDETDDDLLPLVAVIRPSGESRCGHSTYRSNHLLSVYGREGLERCVSSVRRQGRVLFIDRKKTEDLQGRAQLHLLRGLGDLPLDRIIHRSGALGQAHGHPQPGVSATDVRASIAAHGGPGGMATTCMGGRYRYHRTRSFYASILRRLDVAAVNEPSRVFLRCALKDVPAARSLLAAEVLAGLEGQAPPAVPYVLTEGGMPITTHAAEGLVL